MKKFMIGIILVFTLGAITVSGRMDILASDDAEGYNFSMLIARTNQKKDVYRSDEKIFLPPNPMLMR